MIYRLKRIYEPPAPEDGLRVLVERLWARGLTRERAQVGLWLKEAAPTAELRRWFGHAPARWDEFRRRYALELAPRLAAIVQRLHGTGDTTVTLLFAARETRYNNAAALREMIENRSVEN